MKKLMLQKGKAMACLILMCLILAQSCKKETRIPVEIPNTESQFIKEELIEHWLKQNPLSQVLVPDWTKARQALYQGKRIVRVPILNVDNLNYATAVSANNAGYYTQHPPELFFIQNTDGQMAGYLLNFIPKDAKHNFGENGIWTGDLVEWNIKGDTLHVMEIAANKIIKNKLIVPASTIKTNSLSAVLKQNKLAVAANNGNGGFWSFLGRVLGAIGNFLGLPTRDTIIDGLRIDWGQISTNIMSWFDGAESYDGGGGGGGGGYLSAGGPIYVSYLGTGVSTGGGSSPDISSMVYSQYNVYKSGGPYNPPAPPNEDGIYVMEYLSLTPAAQEYILDYRAIPLTKMLRDYLNVNGWTPENLEFASFVVEYSMNNPNVLFQDLNDINNIVISTVNLPNLDVSNLSNYPEFKSLVQDLPNFLTRFPNVLKALSYTTGFTEKKIMQLMQPGKGPKVVVVQNLKDKDGHDILGHYDKNTKTLQIDDGYVNGLSIVNSPSRYQGIGLILVISTLHEFVHFGAIENGAVPVIKNRFKDPQYEPGWDFERAIQPSTNPGDITPDNAHEWLKYYRIKPKN